MKRSVLPGVLAMTILAAGTAPGRQSPPPPQQDAASPQVTAGSPDLAVTMKVLEEKLRSVGRLTWTQNTRNLNGKIDRETFWRELLSAVADPKSCSLAASWEASPSWQAGRASVYLEEVSDVEVVSGEDFIHRHGHQVPGPGQADYHEEIQPPLYSVEVNSWGSFDFRFSSHEAADQFAAVLRESVKQCTAVPVVHGPVNDGPGLSETLNFIAEKLTTQGRVDSRVAVNGNMTTSPTEYLQASPSPTTCTMRIDATGWYSGQLSFHRIGKIEVMKVEDFFARRFWAASLRSEDQVTAASHSFVLDITNPDGESKQLYFSDEALANRVAKAMNHAAELCGAGANSEPF